MITIDEKLFELLKGSSCFGIAPDLDTPECQKCDVHAQCKAKAENGSTASPPLSKKIAEEPMKEKTTTAPKKSKSATKSSLKPEKKPKKTKKETAPVNPDMPDFKPMSLSELKKLADKRNVTWKEYESEQITRMRLVMALKASYK